MLKENKQTDSTHTTKCHKLTLIYDERLATMVLVQCIRSWHTNIYDDIYVFMYLLFPILQNYTAIFCRGAIYYIN